MKTIIIGTYVPKRCGIATFTNDFYKSLLKNSKDSFDILAISDGLEPHYPLEVKRIINQSKLIDYIKAAHWINHNYDLCIIQHEFGIFAGDAGGFINELVEVLNIPLITNLHTILDNPSEQQRKNILHLAAKSSKITVMTKKAIQILKHTYQINPTKIAYIPHGVPEFPLTQIQAKQKLGLGTKKILLSFGFLGRNKGYETAIEAVSMVNNKDFIYIILGTTHPNVFKQEGESYRNDLVRHVDKLEANQKVVFINQFAQDDLLQTYLSACDMYISPYPNANQVSSGTLAFAMGAGAAILSTPYWYAVDLLSNGRGILFDFKDSSSLAKNIQELLDNPQKLAQYRSSALELGSTMTWRTLGIKHLKLIKTVYLENTSNQKLTDLTWKNKIISLNIGKTKGTKNMVDPNS